MGVSEDAPWLGLADDIEGTDQLSGWVVDRTPTPWPPWRPGSSGPG
ncbi:hypothetical protein OG625_38580 [Streptomyces sp. NBC_01351]|nr:hypothetical protein [Streptomyces sp. NBC_01351]